MIKRDFLYFNIIYISFRFAVVIVSGYIYNARIASVYFYITAVLCDVPVFIIFIVLGNIIFFKEDVDIVYLIINN